MEMYDVEPIPVANGIPYARKFQVEDKTLVILLIKPILIDSIWTKLIKPISQIFLALTFW